MGFQSLEQKASQILNKADIEINGNKPHDIQIYNPDFYKKIFSKGSLGLGESYMDGDWDVSSLDQFFYKTLSSNLEQELKSPNIFLNILTSKLSSLFSNISHGHRKSKAFEVGKKHYDLGNELYEIMLDNNMTYTCGYWKDAKNLDEAQTAKLDLVCKKIGLKEGDFVLDIGCGFGSFARHASKNYKAKVKGLTISEEQVKYTQEINKDLTVAIKIQDYRDETGKEKFNSIVSLGMFEHVGIKNHRTYMKKVSELLKDNGIFLLHTIGRKTSSKKCDPWIKEYIFPNSLLPSQQQIAEATEGILVEEDSHNFGADYDKTLMTWHENFTNSWLKLKAQNPKKYDDRFKRMWDYYLLSCAGAFRARKLQLWQKVFSKNGVKGGYKSIR